MTTKMLSFVIPMLVCLGCGTADFENSEGLWRQSEFSIATNDWSDPGLTDAFSVAFSGLQFDYNFGKVSSDAQDSSDFLGYDESQMVMEQWKQNFFEGCQADGGTFLCFAPPEMLHYDEWSTALWDQLVEYFGFVADSCRAIENESLTGSAEGLLINADEIFMVSTFDFYCQDIGPSGDDYGSIQMSSTLSRQ